LNSLRRRLILKDRHVELPRLMPATELMVAPLPERQPLLDPILASNSLALLYGERGLGKTFVALGIAWAVASGASFLGWTASRPHRVLYIDGEMAAVDIRERLRLLGSAPATLDFLIADLSSHSLPDLGYYEGQGRLQQAWGNPELVVLDNLSSLAGFKSGDPDCWSELQRFLMLQRRHGRAVLVVHHANKQGKQLATLLEANWLIARGNNLKITDEFLNPNRAVPNGEQTRWSLVYELTPIQFVQIRTGFRWNDGIPQDNSQHGRLYFVELHGYF